MSQNDIILLNQLLLQKKEEIGSGIDESTFFEIFSAEQVLKDYDLTYEEVEDGIVGEGGDGGIDALYVFVNDALLDESDNYSNFKKNGKINLVFIQAKTSTGFNEAAIDRFISSTRDLLDLSKSLKDLESVYNKKLLSKIDLFRSTFIKLASKFPVLSISYYYVTKGIEVHPNVIRKTEPLQALIVGLFKPSSFSFEFIKANDLLELSRKSPVQTHTMKLSENPISTGQLGYVCLVNLKDYFDFITDESKKLKKAIFEGNVRDYQGKNDVNDDIEEALKNPTSEDFWWLNNGVTIVSSKASLSGKVLTIENPEIVNGLQTSTQIFNFFSAAGIVEDSRNILVRVISIASDNETSRDRIIKATNFQTPIPVASLRATDKIHRDIEQYFFPYGLYYDRRKNYYKNLGKPIKSIVSISYLAQAVLSCALLDPSNARARPSSLLKDDTNYLNIFNPTYPIELYYKCVYVMRQGETYLKADARQLDTSQINNLKFSLAMMITLTLSGLPKPKVSDVAKIDIDKVNSIIGQCISIVYDTYMKLGGTDQVSKNRDFVEELLELHMRETLGKKV